VTHWPLEVQQPLGQLEASHTQAPLEHRWPSAHAAPPPQVQVPKRQASARLSHGAHAPPRGPQALRSGVAVHVVPTQQP
jgi:hypothetical protein